MSLYKKITCFLIAFIFYATPAGCLGNLGVAEEMLEPIFPQEYTYSEQPENVWQAVTVVTDLHITRTEGHILVRDSESHIISWIEQLGMTSGNREVISNNQKRDKDESPYQSEVREVGQGGVAITTISIRNRSDGSLLRIRRIYYGQLTQPRMVHSRGVFANVFQKNVNKELGKNADNKNL